MTDHRDVSRRRWGAAAAGWKENAARAAEITMPVSTGMIDALEPQPGEALLELAAGTGDVGYLAYELILPGGTLITSDFAPEMLTAAQERAKELGIEGARFKQIDAHSIDLDAASLDAVLCRFGYMLMTDPEAALRETRRVLKPGGRVVLAVWASAEQNPWASVIRTELQDRGLLERDDPGVPGPFALADTERMRALLAQAGFFEEVELRSVDIAFPFPDIETFVEVSGKMGTAVGQGIAALTDREAFMDAVRTRMEPHRLDDGSYRAPGRAWVVSATA